ncbi:hypothetical protein [Bordetella genomosp. 11]|nr:hypothetical protein [Bordetella genomosp. 11]
MFTAIVIYGIAATYAIHYRSQPLVDLFNFRQAQTALTSYWMIQDGWRLAYETPIGGAPWAIPFEFPVYQAIVAGISWAFNWPMDPVGRMVTFGFLTACVVPALKLQRRLQLSPEAFFVFCCLLFSAPIYMYWGRTFMIETAALFFVFASLPHFVDMLQGPGKTKAAIFFSLWTCLSLLQKVTTGLPVVAILGTVWLINAGRVWRGHGFRSILRGNWVDALAFAAPVILAFAWTEYTNQVRMENTLGAYLTNAGLTTWNWGTMHQRVSAQFWREVLWGRLFERNLAGVLGVGVIAAALCIGRLGVRRKLMLVTLLLGLLPFFTFTNLYIVHDYYPTACVIFLIAALALAIGQWARAGNVARLTSLVLLMAFVGHGVYQFRKVYQSEAQYRDRVARLPELTVARTLEASTSSNAALVLYGYDWSSQMAYLTQRRTFTVPKWPGKLTEVWNDPQRFLGTSPLGAIAVCNNIDTPTPHQVANRFLAHQGYYAGRTESCTVLVRDDGTDSATIKRGDPVPPVGDCQARIDATDAFPHSATDGSERIVIANGSISRTATAPRDIPRVLLALARNGVIVRSGRALIIPPAITGIPRQGFSAMLDTTGLAGTYDAVVLSREDDGVKQCELNKPAQVTLRPTS